MEDILDVYEMPYKPERPVVCMDEKPYQLLGESRKPLPMRPGDNTKIDSEYVRKGTSSIFVFTEPLGGIRHISVREQRKAVDWAEEIKYMVDRMYPDVERIILVMDNLNIHAISLLYKRFPAPEARRIDSIERLRRELALWETRRNQEGAKITWHFTIDKSREKLVSLYPKFDNQI